MKLFQQPRTLVAAGAVIAIAVTAALGSIELRLRQNVVDSAGWVTHTLDVEREFDAVLLAATDAETGQRGFLLVRNTSYLVPYTAASQEIQARLDTLASLTSDSASQQARLVKLRALLGEKFGELKETVDLASGGDTARALLVVSTNRGHDLMDQVRATIKDGVAEEEQVLAVRQAELASRIATRGYVMWALIVTEGLVLGGLFLAMRRLQRLEPMVTVCAESRTIEYENEWVTFDEYLARRFRVRVTPGLSPDEAKKLMARIDETQIFDRR
jgi:CHASE3 domain sensor protein